MKRNRFTESYAERIVNKAYNYRDKIYDLRERVISDMGLDEVEQKDCEDYYLDFQGNRPEDPENRLRYDIGCILVGLSEAWPGLERIIENL